MSKDKVKKLEVVSTDLERILDSLDDFEWIPYIDDKQEISSASVEICVQLGIVECLYDLHLIGKGTRRKLSQCLELAAERLDAVQYALTKDDI